MSSSSTTHIERVLAVAQGVERSAKTLITSNSNQSSASGAIEITSSWSRCVAEYGLDPAQRHETLVLDKQDVQTRQERLHGLMDIAHHEMSNLYQQIAGSDYAIILTDQDGVILDNITDQGLEREFSRAGLWLGAVWAEQAEGTNGIGTCLIEKRPVTVHQDEHFRPSNIGLTCSGAPIFDPSGQLLAVLDASSARSRDSKRSQFHTAALVTLSAKLIENCHFLQRYRQHWVLRFHSRPEFVGTISEGMIAFDGAGKVLAVNQSALNQLRYGHHQDVLSKPIEHVFSTPFDALMLRSSSQPSAIWPLPDQQGHVLYAMLLGAQQNLSIAVQQRARNRFQGASFKSFEPSNLNQLIGGDPVMAHNVHCAERVLDKDISIILSGETGTGKEVFARALHKASARAEKPFLAMNCSAIPEQLIESELFGYKDGAFTGARRGGMRGKIEQANGGTLFLDEIGDMPLHLQTRLLRVLEDQQVTPLGSDKPVDVNVQIISASHRDLDQWVAEGKFREDLYYRLNGITLVLPPLRERTDFAELVATIVAAESSDQGVKISRQAFTVMQSYHWPGNLRQLRNVMRTAIALCEHGEIRPSDLPSQMRASCIETWPNKEFMPVDDSLNGPTASLGQVGCVDNSQSLQTAERRALLETLDKHEWNVSKAADQLKLSRNTLYRKLRKHRIDPKKYR